MARHVGRSKPGSKPIQLFDRLSLRLLGQQAYHVWLRELLRYLCSNSSSRLFTFFYTLSATRVLNSFEELCIMRAAAENSLKHLIKLDRNVLFTYFCFDLFNTGNEGYIIQLELTYKHSIINWVPNTFGLSVAVYWRCPWCSRYRRRKWTRRHEFKSWTRLIAFHITLIPLRKV